MYYNDIKNILKKYNQEHLLDFYSELNEDEKENLLLQIENIDFELMDRLCKNVGNQSSKEKEIELVKCVVKDEMNNKEDYIKIGIEAIKNGELAVCSMAGGQGTRLGHAGPKGTYVVDITPPKSIFEILADKLKTVYKKYGKFINWYIMTSEANNDETVKFFEENDYFGYNKSFVKFFKQGELPLTDFNGKIILQEKGKIFFAADGNGGIFEALHKNHILEDMTEKNIKYLCIGNVDNILINQVDELLLGIMEKENYKLAGKSIIKRSADEKVGVFCKINGRPAVIEYSDIDEEMARKTNEDGSLLLGEAHFGCNVFSIELLKKIAMQKLPYHVAKKKNTFIGKNGEKIQSEIPNTYKFEAFIFDGFMMSDDVLVFRVKREEEFAPIKNSEGEDSPATAKALYTNYIANNNHE